MVHQFHQDQLEKTHFLIFNKKCLHHVEIDGPCQKFFFQSKNSNRIRQTTAKCNQIKKTRSSHLSF